MFLDNEKHKTLAFPAGEGADQLLRREADEGYASTASSVRQQTNKLQFIKKQKDGIAPVLRCFNCRIWGRSHQRETLVTTVTGL